MPRPSDAFHVYDTTLRDGSQREGMVLSVNDKLAIARHLDDLGVGFLEGGWPGANPKDAEFFRRARTELRLTTAQLAAFGSTRRPHGDAAADLAHLRESGAGVVTLVAKSDVRHVERALRTTREENLAMVRDSVAHLRGEGQRVFLDAEHFFDGWKSDAAYALEVLRTAAEAGADVVVLCDTNGGMLPAQLQDVVGAVAATGLRVGIHAHDDTACAVANSLSAVEAGATHVQGTANGYGERSGNADLFSVVAALEVKLGRQVLPPGRLAELGRVAHAVAEVANIAPDAHQPWVGASAFAHKAGLHVSAVKADPDLYQHCDPAAVGNDMRLLVSELAGRATIELKGRELGLVPDGATVARVIDRVKDLESVGWSFAHKAGLHVSAVKADPDLYQHCDPAAVGNDMRLLVSELAGRATIELKGRELGLVPDGATVARVIDRVKDLESVGWSFEAAEASFELLLREEMGERPRFFDLESWRVIVERRGGDEVVSEATVKLHAQGSRIVATGEGNGPVNALDNALRQALEQLHPHLSRLELVDYKVRIVSGAHGTGAVTRVLVETTDGAGEWTTVGVHENVIAASWQALEDAYTSGLLRSAARSPAAASPATASPATASPATAQPLAGAAVGVHDQVVERA